MYEWPREAVARNMPVSVLYSFSRLAVGAAYLAVYALLDWASQIGPITSVGITPWNPQTGLSFALVLLLGRSYIPWLFLAPLLTNIFVLGIDVPIAISLLAALIIGTVYGTATWVLTHPSLKFDRTLGNKQSLALLIAVATVSTTIVAVSYAGVLALFGLISSADLVSTMLSYGIGDLIGVTVLTPFLLIALTRRRVLVPSFELVMVVIALAATVAAVFGLSDTFRVKHYYLFFLPVMWTAVRFGLEGVTAALVLTQVGLMAAIQYAGLKSEDVTAFQALMIVLSLTGLTIGAVVNEQLRTQAKLRRNQEALDRAARLDTMGAFAASLAHEINQPLTAISNYARLTKMAVTKDPIDSKTATEAAEHAMAQVDRAAEVVRRVRDFIRHGRNEMVRQSCADLVREAITQCQFEVQNRQIHLETRIARNLPPVVCDGLQIQQALINLIRNAAESISSGGSPNGRIVVEADLDETGRVNVTVRDNGPGFDPDILERALSPLTTTKSEGLGLGLALARQAAETHGGQLLVESTGSGAAVSFSLPAAYIRDV